MTVALPVALAIATMAIVGLLSVRHRSLRAVVLGTVDPRPLALFRIALGLCLLGYVIEIAPVSTYLFSDEGLLPSAAVPQTYGRGALAGYGDGVRSEAGFVDLEAVLRHVTHGRWSLLFFWDHPSFVHATLVATALACLGMIAGIRSRTSTVVAWLLLTGLLRRGDAHWGGEQVLFGLLFIMMFARSGDAYGIDAWRRARSLARRGRLDRRDGPDGGRGLAPCPEHPEGLAAIYRRVPAWPQALLVAQLVICYLANGWTKAGPTWTTGETLRLAVHLDKYARVDWHGFALALGPWPFRLGTWSVLWWERLFGLVLVGLWLRATQGTAPLEGRARMLSRACWLTLAAALAVWALTPGALHARADVSQARAGALVLLAAGLALVPAWGPRTRAWVRRLCAPVPWLMFGLVFHFTSLVLFELGAFASATASTYLLCGLGPLAVLGVQRLMRTLGRLGLPIPEHLRRATPIEAEDPSLPHLRRDATALPGWAIAGAGGLVLTGFILALLPATASIGWWHAGWLVSATGLLAIGARAGRRPPTAPARPLAYGPVGRLAAGGLFTYHLVSLCAWQLPPSWPSLSWRNEARGLLAPWTELSFTRQLWSMFAPNGPRQNASVRTIVIDGDGTEHDLRTELQHPENLKRPYLRNDRWRKVDESVGGYRPWLAPWHARYVCRRWALEHDGALPQTVRISRVHAPFAPMRPVDPQQWFWDQATVTPLAEVQCASEPFAQPSPEIRARHGLPPDAAVRHHAWPKNPRRPHPYEPLWVGLALTLGGALWVRARQESKAEASTSAEPAEP